jgi:membrane protein
VDPDRELDLTPPADPATLTWTTPEGIAAIAAAHRTFGTTALLPTLISALGIERGAGWLILLARWAAVITLAATGLAVLYRFGPAADRPNWQWLSAGGATALALWLAGSIALSVYVDNLGRYQAVYGALASVIVLMLWLYLASFAALLGAEIDACRRDQRRGQALSRR